jgi:uncharacterized Zn finger protein
MRHTCPKCGSVDTALRSVEEGWDPTGPYGIHTTKKLYRCRQCGADWNENCDVTAPVGGGDES